MHSYPFSVRGHGDMPHRLTANPGRAKRGLNAGSQFGGGQTTAAVIPCRAARPERPVTACGSDVPPADAERHPHHDHRHEAEPQAHFSQAATKTFTLSCVVDKHPCFYVELILWIISAKKHVSVRSRGDTCPFRLQSRSRAGPRWLHVSSGFPPMASSEPWRFDGESPPRSTGRRSRSTEPQAGVQAFRRLRRMRAPPLLQPQGQSLAMNATAPFLPWRKRLSLDDRCRGYCLRNRLWKGRS